MGAGLPQAHGTDTPNYVWYFWW